MLYDGGDLWPIDFDNLHYDWFLSDFTTVVINVVISQQHSHARGNYDEWTGGRKMDSEEFVGYFMEPFMSGYRQVNALDPAWLRRLPRFLNRHYFTFFVDSLWDPGFRHLPEEEQAAEFPWRTLKQLEDEVAGSYWERFNFSRLA